MAIDLCDEVIIICVITTRIIIDIANDTVAFAKKKMLQRRKRQIEKRIEKLIDKEYEKQGYIRIEI